MVGSVPNIGTNVKNKYYFVPIYGTKVDERVIFV